MAKILTQTVETVSEIKCFLDPKLKLGENEMLQFQTASFAGGPDDFARASLACRDRTKQTRSATVAVYSVRAQLVT